MTLEQYLNEGYNKHYWTEIGRAAMAQIPMNERQEFIKYVSTRVWEYEDSDTRQVLIDRFLYRMDIGL